MRGDGTSEWPALAFRPPTVRNRLRRGSRACPLPLRDVVGGLVAEAVAVPLVWAGEEAVARAALVAAKEAGSVVGLAARSPAAPERWFDAVVQVADEIAPGLPLLLGAVVSLRPGAIEEARSLRWSQRLVEAGVTHLVLEVDALDPSRRAEALARAAEPALERGLGVECLLPAAPGALPGSDEVFSLLAELGSLGASPDLAGVRLPEPLPVGGEEAAARALERLAESTGGVGLACRGQASARLARIVPPGTLRAADDGGLAESAASRGSDRERGEARAYGEAASLIDAVRSDGSAALLAQALARAREE